MVAWANGPDPLTVLVREKDGREKKKAPLTNKLTEWLLTLIIIVVYKYKIY